MTAVLQPTDALRSDRQMAAFDDNVINYSSSSTDWRAKYMEVADMLAETRAELDDFQHSSKELEEELERELERTEKTQQDLRAKLARAENERDDWKTKFMTLQTTHNTTSTSLQRELDTLRQDYQKIKIELRELEMGNDDLERNERAISSSLQDAESRYSRTLEEKIILEQELLVKADIEEECQHLKDELRDANEEINILKDQLSAAHSRPSLTSGSAESSAPSSSIPHTTSSISNEDLLSIPVPQDLSLSDLTPPPDTPAKDFPLVTPNIASPRPTRKGNGLLTSPTMLQRAGFQPPRSGISTPVNGMSPLLRSSTIPGLSTSPSRHPRTPLPRPVASRNLSSFSTSTTSTVPATASKSKGVQMVSEMRARVKVLEQKIHTRVPRLRMGSVTNRTAASAMPPPPIPKASSSASPAMSVASSRSMSHDDRPKQRKASVDLGTPTAGDSSGWVLIMEDSPSPVKNKDKDKELRRTSSPSAPSAFRPVSSTSIESPPSTGHNSPSPSALSQSVMPTGIRRPQSRLSVSTEGRSSTSTNATVSSVSSIPTPSSRPCTPTFLPVPSQSVYGGGGLKRSTGPVSGAYAQNKRSSLGSSTAGSPTTDSASFTSFTSFSNVTVRQPSKIGLPAALSQSRIGRPTHGGASGRRSVGESADGLLDPNARAPGPKSRARSGSTAAVYGRT